MLQTVEPTTGPITADPVNRHQVWDLGREVSSHLHVKLMEFIQPYSWQDLSFVAVAKGPGGFTGTRIGVVAARTLAQQLEIPLFGVSSLAAIAAQSIQQTCLEQTRLERTQLDQTQLDQTQRQPEPTIAVTMPAKRDAVYGAIYQAKGEDLIVVRTEEVVPEGEWAEILQGWERPLHQVTTGANAGTANSVTGVMHLATVRWQQQERPDWSSVMPFYGQHPVHR